jgi:hypothetical protein
MVIALVVKRIGLNKKIGRAWLDVENPWQHPKIEREAIRPPPLDETEREPEKKNTYGEFFEIRIDFDDATTYNHTTATTKLRCMELTCAKKRSSQS